MGGRQKWVYTGTTINCGENTIMNTLFVNGRVWVRKGQWEEALAVRDNRVLAVGTREEVTSKLTNPYETVDMEGGMLMPGFHDGHLHLLMGGFSLLQLSLEGITDRHQALGLIQEKAREVEKQNGGKDQWVVGIGFDENRVQLRKADLDKLCPQIPVLIRTRDLHSAIVNEVALKLAGITSETPYPPTGKIERDDQGQPTGFLREEAVRMVDSVVPLPDAAVSLQAMKRAQEQAFRYGITSVSDSIRVKNLPIYQEFHQQGHRKIRINGWRVIEEWSLENVPSNPASDMGFQVRTLKGFVDGAMGSDTAWLLEDFSHRPGYRGIGCVEERELTKVMRKAEKLGYWVALHAIGDRANRVALNAFEQAQVTSSGRNRIEHAQLLTPKDIPRFNQLGIVASMQPIHCTDDMAWKIRKVGLERVKSAYAWRSLLDSGATLVFGTDWPVADLNPMQGLRAAVIRRDADGNPKEGWNLAQAVTLEEALDIYTRGGAFGAGWEADIGTLAPGMRADMILLDNNLFEVDPLEYAKVRVKRTWVDGEEVMNNEDDGKIKEGK